MKILIDLVVQFEYELPIRRDVKPGLVERSIDL
jgi:hypothetical protein